MPSPSRLLVPVVALALLPWASATAEVRRCVAAGGQAIFTDRKCEEVGATAALPRDAMPNAGTYSAKPACARRLEDLVYEIGAAIDAGDANRLAGVYHWTGMSGVAGYQVWQRLDAIASRPLVDIVPVLPRAAQESAAPVTGNDAGVPPADPELYPQTAVRRTPVALRVEQTLRNSATPSRTVFGLVRNFGCWWVRL